MASRPGGSLDSCYRLVGFPSENMMIDPQGPQPNPNLARLIGRIGPQSVVHSEGDHPPSLFARPAVRKDSKCQAVRPP